MIFLSLITALSFLAYCPVLCYLDWKYRDIRTHKIWLPLIAFNIPILLAGYATGTYPFELGMISFIAVLLWFVLVFMDKLNGADFVWLSLISVFIPINPFTGQPFMLMLSFFLVGMTAATMWYFFLDNTRKKHQGLPYQKLGWNMNLNIPHLIPISCALVLALVVS